MHRFIAISAIGPSALRGQGASGVIKACRDHLSSLDLKRFRRRSEKAFLLTLDEATEELRKVFPIGARNWGAARKALNLFLRDVYYNRFLFERYKLFCLNEEWFEIPLDSLIAKALKRHSGKGSLPNWPGLKRLKKKDSDSFQEFAKIYASEHNTTRIHLDMRLWAVERER